MSESHSLKHRLKILKRIINSNHKKWTNILESNLKKLINLILKHPTSFILWPAALTFILSYPALYTLYASPTIITNSGSRYSGSPSSFIKQVSVDSLLKNDNVGVNNNDINNEIDFSFKQLWIQPNIYSQNDLQSSSSLSTTETSEDNEHKNFKTLDKDFLLTLLELQTKLLNGLELYNSEKNYADEMSENIDDDNDLIPNNKNKPLAFLHSPLEYWNNNASQLVEDDNVLKTIHSKESVKSSAGIPLGHLGLFSGIVKVDGLVKSAEAIQISMFYKPNNQNIDNGENGETNKPDAGQIWDNNLKNVQLNTSKESPFLIFTQNQIDPNLNENSVNDNNKEINENQIFNLKIKRTGFFETLSLKYSLIVFILYVIISLHNLHSIKSRSGLLLAFTVELTLSIFSAATLTSFLFNNLNLLQLPLQLVLSIVLIICTENMFRLVTQVSKTSEELSLSSRLTSSFIKSGITSSNITLISIFICTFIISPFVGNLSKEFCCFTSLAVLIDHFLHLTYFTAVLSVDIRRLELEDFLQKSNNNSKIYDDDAFNGNNNTNNDMTNIQRALHGDVDYSSANNYKKLNSSNSSSFFSEFDSNGNISFKKLIYKHLLRIKLPLFNSIYSTIVFISILIFYILQWTDGLNSFDIDRSLSQFNQTNIVDKISSNKENRSIDNSLENGRRHKIYASTFKPSHDTQFELNHNDENIIYFQNPVLDETYVLSVNDFPTFTLFLDKRGLATELSLLAQFLNEKELVKNDNSIGGNKSTRDISKQVNTLSITVDGPVVVTIKNHIDAIKDNEDFVDFNINTTYQFDIYYLFEFVSCLMFILASSSIILKISINTDNYDSLQSLSNNIKSNESSAGTHSNDLHSRDLVNGHFLDIVRVCTSSCPFIVSVGMDHKILVWSPLTIPIPPPTQLPVSGRLLPITNIVMSNSGSLIAVFSNSGIIKCWSRLSMSWVWTLQIDPSTIGGTPIESFFRMRTSVAGTNRRKVVARNSTTKNLKPRKPLGESTKNAPTGTESTKLSPAVGPHDSSNPGAQKKALKPRGRATLQRTLSNSILKANNRSLSIDSTFDKSTNLKQLSQNTDNEFVIAFTNGEMLTVNCEDGTFTKTTFSKEPVVFAKKLSSPRVNDRLVCTTRSGNLVVGTVINNKWKVRNIKVQKESYNSGRSLPTPAALSRTSSFNFQSFQEYQKFSAANSLNTVSNNPYATNSDISASPLVGQHSKFQPQPSLSTTPYQNDYQGDNRKDYKDCVVETVPFVGMIIRACGLKAELIDIQTGIMLMEFDIGQFKESTFQVFYPEPSHCRFCGCASIASFSVAYTELETNTLVVHTFSIDNRAKNNICLRVERDPRETRCLGFASVTEHQHWISNVEGWCATDLNMLLGVRRKDNEDIEGPTNGLPRDYLNNSINSLDFINHDLRNRKSKISSAKKAQNVYPKISSTWEAWTMSASGHIRYYSIPDGTDSGLLIKRLGPVKKFGHKSIAVSFGNIMKILYLGNDNLIEEGEHDTEGLSASSQTSTALSFINRRRKMILKKYELTHSTNFNDTTVEETVVE
ncbi:hypothetical protein BVG19_g1286 [[Candida] boidinii]|nr:hypothetical protein BVG19_g1286 [[Candida] boidinii]OWB52723.1 hypothetical protein B5S27_g4304 [[Candida] boidinii]